MAAAEVEELVLANKGLAHLAVKRLGMTRLGAVMDADDFTQEALAGLVQAARSYDPARGSFSGWAMFYCQNRMIDAVRVLDGRSRGEVARNQPAPPLCSLDTPLRDGEEDTLADLLEGDAISPQEWAEAIETRRELREAVERLPSRLRIAVALRFGHGLPLKQIGRGLGVSESRAWQIVEQAIEMLRRGWRTWDDED